jgi:pyrroloquinoline quinone (PQQ) biosynthesis protein C
VPRGTAEVRFRLLAPETESADKTGQDWLKEQLEKDEWHSEKVSEIFKNHHETKTCEKLSIF